MENHNEYSTSSDQSSEASSSSEVSSISDREIVEAVFGEWYSSLKKDEIVLWADEAMNDAEILSGKIFGRITSEEDAMEKAEAVWIELDWCGDDIKNERPYTTIFYDEYGVWLVDSFLMRGVINSESNPFPVPGSGYCAIIRKSDGKVLAAWIS